MSATSAALPMATREDVGRNFTWVAVGKSGVHYDETTFRSISNIPSHDPIVRITAHAVGRQPHESWQYSAIIPESADTPICFTRRSINVQSGVHEAILCLGWREGVSGFAHLLWINDTGDCCMTDRDLNDIDERI
jgi:hypothetical protein